MSSRIPDCIEGYGSTKRFAGAFANLGKVTRAPVQVWSAQPGAAKVLPSIRAAIEACELKDCPGSSGRRDTLREEVAMTVRKRRSDRSGRGALPSPGRPFVARRED